MPVEVEGLVPSAKDQADTDEEEMAKLVQIQAQDATVNILCVYNVAGGSATHEELPASDGEERGGVAGREGDLATEGTGREEAGGREGGGGSGEADEVEKDESVEEMEARRRWLSEIDFGSCHVALTMNNRLLILHVPHRSRVHATHVAVLYVTSMLMCVCTCTDVHSTAGCLYTQDEGCKCIGRHSTAWKGDRDSPHGKVW